MNAEDTQGWIDFCKNNLHIIIPTVIITALIIFLAIIILLAFSIEKIEIIVSKLLSLFTWTGTSIRKKTIAKEVRGRVLQVSKEISKEIKEIMPYDLKIVWVTASDKETFLDRNQVIIRMSNSVNPQRNFVYALSEYVKKGLMVKARSYIDSKIMYATDFAIIRKAIVIGYKEAIEYFNENILQPVFDQDVEIKEYVSQLMDLDNNGMLISVLVREFFEKGTLLWPNLLDEGFKYETKDFLKYLHNISIREPGEFSELTFRGNYFKVSIGLIANSETLYRRGLRYYIRKVSNSLDSGIDTIYLFAKGAIKADFAKEIAEIAKENDARIRKIKHFQYKVKNIDGNYIKGVCICIQTTDILCESIEEDVELPVQ